jgi:hypothetical protein
MKSARLLFLLVVCLIASSLMFGQVPMGNQPTSTTGLSGHGLSKPAGFNKTAALIPGKISYQGLLTTGAGSPATDGSYTLLFELLDASSSGNLLWSETQAGVTVSRGTFSVMLGSVTPLTGIFSQPLWLQVTATAGPGISSSVLFAPRTELASAPYALGPWQQDSLENYTLKTVRIGSILNTGIAGLEITDPAFAAIQMKTSNVGSTTGYWVDKGDATGRNYFVLRTVGLDKWSLGTIGSDNFSLFSWPLFKEIIYATAGGQVGINTNAPTTGFDVNAAMHARDTLTIGTFALPGYFSINTQAGGYPGVLMNSYSGLGTGFYVYDDSGHSYSTFQPDFDGQGGFFTVNRNNFSAGFMVDGNFFGTGDPYVAVMGNTRSAVFNMNASGDASVMLPDNSISSHEILDGPGIARSFTSGGTGVSTSGVTNITSTTITVPEGGYVVAHGYAIGGVFGTTIGNIRMSVEPLITDGPSAGNYALVGSQGEVISSSTTRWGTLACERTFSVGGAGTYTYYLNADRGDPSGSATVYYTRLVLTYYPKSYGTVAAGVAASEAPLFSRATPVTETSAGSSTQQSTTVYQVDLRELELRAANARADAEKAERRLIEARMTQQQAPSPDQQH